VKILLRSTVFFLLVFVAIFYSKEADIEQLLFDDLRYISFIDPKNKILGISIISTAVVVLTNFISNLMRPFIDIYLMYYFKFSFYILINLFCVSTVLILLRVYGYSRLMVLIYILSSSIFLYLEDKIY
tara:strand:- start:175 stop:558 length:384 start_codon:yes stop_codon:yes gene_type:complete